MKKNCLLSLMMLCLVNMAWAKDAAEVYYKELKRNFAVNSNVVFKLDISFADIHLTTWEQNTIDIVVKLDANARTQERADEIFEGIGFSVNEGKEYASLSLSGGMNCNSKKNQNESFNVHVEIRMPLKATLDGHTSFGSFNVGDMQGPFLVDHEYGSLNINGLWSYENDLKISFGNASVNGTNGGDFRNEYGKLEIKLLQGNAEIQSAFGDLDIDRVRKECKDLDIKIEYADADIGIASDAGFRFETDASYGDIDLPDSAKETSKDSDYVSKSVRGTIGNGEGKLEVECDFGDVDIDMVN